jgi:hypothetical protein
MRHLKKFGYQPDETPNLRNGYINGKIYGEE